MTTPASPSGQQTNLRRVFYQCQLGKSDLDSLFSMACEGIPLPQVKISTTAGETLFWKSSLEELIESVSRDVPEIHEDWANLTLQADAASQERGVQIGIDKERTEVSVSGSDTTWAYGQMARIEKFLVSRGAVFSSPRYENAVTFGFLIFLVALGAFLLIHGVHGDTAAECVKRAKNASTNDVAFSVSMVAAFSFGFLFLFFQFLKRRISRARLKVGADISRDSWWSRLSNGERISVVVVPLTAIAALSAVITAVHNAWGK
ncbi:hypothetical protein [Streptomyces violascens]|uniref:hypothetical protein n=1 Tax=Streptomyces violascens TaxID=67381 RepID=UPI003653C59A